MTALGSQAPGLGDDTTNGAPSAGATPGQIDAAAHRFASLSPAARHAWLAPTCLRSAPAPSPWPSCHDDHRRPQAGGSVRPRPGRGAPGLRLAWLHWRSRRVPAAVLALAVRRRSARRAAPAVDVRQRPLHLGAPGDRRGRRGGDRAGDHHARPVRRAGRTASRWLPCLRLATALAMIGLAIGTLQLTSSAPAWTAASSCWPATCSASPASAC